MSADFDRWYTDVVRKAELADWSGIRGMMVVRPYGWAMWEASQRAFDDRIKERGHENGAVPRPTPRAARRKAATPGQGRGPEGERGTRAPGRPGPVCGGGGPAACPVPRERPTRTCRGARPAGASRSGAGRSPAQRRSSPRNWRSISPISASPSSTPSRARTTTARRAAGRRSRSLRCRCSGSWPMSVGCAAAGGAGDCVGLRSEVRLLAGQAQHGCLGGLPGGA